MAKEKATVEAVEVDVDEVTADETEVETVVEEQDVFEKVPVNKNGTKKKNIEEETVEEVVEEEELESEEEETSQSEMSAVLEQANPNWRDGLSEEEVKTMEALLKKTSFRAAPLMLDSKRNRENLGKELITDDGRSMNTADHLKEDMLNLNASAQAGRILKGRIVGCRSAGEDTISTNLAVVEYGNATCTVLIPDYLLFNFNVTENRSSDRQNRIRDRIVRMIGTEISFIVKQFDQKTKTGYADRLKAMEQEGYNNYIRRLNNTNKPRVKVGDVIKGRITAVGRNFITVYALGSESNIYQDAKKGMVEVSWHHIFDLRQTFKVNDVVACKVLNVDVQKYDKYGEKYTLVGTELSVKRTEDNPQEKFFGNYKIGQFCECLITTVDESLNGVYGIINGAGQVDCMIAYPTYGKIPEPGARRIVRITNMQTKTESGSLLEKDGSPVRRIYCVFADQG